MLRPDPLRLNATTLKRLFAFAADAFAVVEPDLRAGFAAGDTAQLAQRSRSTSDTVCPVCAVLRLPQAAALHNESRKIGRRFWVGRARWACRDLRVKFALSDALAIRLYLQLNYARLSKSWIRLIPCGHSACNWIQHVSVFSHAPATTQ